MTGYNRLINKSVKGLHIAPVRLQYSGWRSYLPPGLQKPVWQLIGEYQYESILVEAGFQFDGTSVPFLFRLILPSAHPQYIEAALVHDWLYANGDDRRMADNLFRQFLIQLGVKPLWAWPMWLAVRLAGRGAWRKRRKKK